jgi:hypothetical protein
MTIDLDERREAVGASERLLETGARSFISTGACHERRGFVPTTRRPCLFAERVGGSRA